MVNEPQERLYSAKDFERYWILRSGVVDSGARISQTLSEICKDKRKSEGAELLELVAETGKRVSHYLEEVPYEIRKSFGLVELEIAQNLVEFQSKLH